jgi:hypothetical protein
MLDQVDSVREVLRDVEEKSAEAMAGGPNSFAAASNELRRKVEAAGEEFLKY